MHDVDEYDLPSLIKRTNNMFFAYGAEVHRNHLIPGGLASSLPDGVLQQFSPVYSRCESCETVRCHLCQDEDAHAVQLAGSVSSQPWRSLWQSMWPFTNPCYAGIRSTFELQDQERSFRTSDRPFSQQSSPCSC
jgi:hypothetical protein